MKKQGPIGGFSKRKFQAAILFLALVLKGNPLGLGRVKLAKLLYFADFELYRKHGRPVTGISHIRMPHGPFPDRLEALIREMIARKLVQERPVKVFGFAKPRRDLVPLVELGEDELDQAEVEMLESVAQRLGRCTGKALEELSHRDFPWLAAKQAQNPIFYQLATAKSQSEANRIWDLIQRASTVDLTEALDAHPDLSKKVRARLATPASEEVSLEGLLARP
ncbi:MAG: SocA family protein [Candidatus Riflebacteria bacterium]|nr:SocA family protein [Candidatus Riflebacteria bacterium]